MYCRSAFASAISLKKRLRASSGISGSFWPAQTSSLPWTGRGSVSGRCVRPGWNATTHLSSLVARTDSLTAELLVLRDAVEEAHRVFALLRKLAIHVEAKCDIAELCQHAGTLLLVIAQAAALMADEDAGRLLGVRAVGELAGERLAALAVGDLFRLHALLLLLGLTLSHRVQCSRNVALCIIDPHGDFVRCWRQFRVPPPISAVFRARSFPPCDRASGPSPACRRLPG